MVAFTALRAQFRDDTQFGADGASPGLARALDRIGWRAVQESTADELASHIVELVYACVDDHHDVELLARAIAETLRHAGPSLDGGLPPVEAYLPAAEEILSEYVRPTPGLEPTWTVGVTRAVRRRSVRALIGAWMTYWVALVLVTLGPAMLLLWRLSRPDQHGSASLGFDDGTLRLKILDGATTAWSGVATVGTIALWLAIPALIIWAIWLVATRPASTPARVATPRPLDALPSADTIAMPSVTREKQRERNR